MAFELFLLGSNSQVARLPGQLNTTMNKLVTTTLLDAEWDLIQTERISEAISMPSGVAPIQAISSAPLRSRRLKSLDLNFRDLKVYATVYAGQLPCPTQTGLEDQILPTSSSQISDLDL